MKWITCEHINVDRVSASWLIKTCVDPYAEFVFVPEAALLATAEREGATPFAAIRWPAVTLNHRHHRCTFEVMLEHFKLVDPVLHRIGHIIRAVVVNGQAHVAPEGLALHAIAEGFASLGLSDDEQLRLQFPVYDALDAYERQRAG
jgi:hypothetical protein